MTPQPWADSITLIRARGPRLAKLIEADGTIIGYDKARMIDATQVTVLGLADVLALLKRLERRPDCAIIRGQLIDGTRAENVRRLAYLDKETGDQPVFRRTACIVQASASHGIKPGCRLRLVFWCERPMSGQELKCWLPDTDTSVFRTVQPIYTAAPVFGTGRSDHLPTRLAEYPGEDWLQCPSAEELAPPAREPAGRPERVAIGAQANAYARAALTKAADAILAAKEGKRHETICLEARSLARLVQPGLLSASDMRAVLMRAAAGAGKDNPDEVESCITWGLNNPSDGVLPEARHAA